jgi:flagellin-like protein
MKAQNRNLVIGVILIVLSFVVSSTPQIMGLSSALLVGGAFFLGIAFGYDFKEVEVTGIDGVIFPAKKPKPKDKTSGVSPVIGIILMVAITVILAAVIAAFVFGIAGNMEISSFFPGNNTVKVLSITATGRLSFENLGMTYPEVEINAMFTRNRSIVQYFGSDLPVPLTHTIDAGSCYQIPSWDQVSCGDQTI